MFIGMCKIMLDWLLRWEMPVGEKTGAEGENSVRVKLSGKRTAAHRLLERFITLRDWMRLAH